MTKACSSIAMLICTIVSTILAGLYFVKVCKFDKFIATLAALPGAFVPIAAALLEYGKKDNYKQVLIPQATRVIFIVSFVPIFFINNLGFSEINLINTKSLLEYQIKNDLFEFKFFDKLQNSDFSYVGKFNRSPWGSSNLCKSGV